MGAFLVLAITTKAVRSLRGNELSFLSSSVYKRVAGSDHKCMFNVMRNCQPAFRRGCAIRCISTCPGMPSLWRKLPPPPLPHPPGGSHQNPQCQPDASVSPRAASAQLPGSLLSLAQVPSSLPTTTPAALCHFLHGSWSDLLRKTPISRAFLAPPHLDPIGRPYPSLSLLLFQLCPFAVPGPATLASFCSSSTWSPSARSPAPRVLTPRQWRWRESPRGPSACCWFVLISSSHCFVIIGPL